MSVSCPWRKVGSPCSGRVRLVSALQPVAEAAFAIAIAADRYGTRLLRTGIGTLTMCFVLTSCDSYAPDPGVHTPVSPDISLEVSVRDDGTATALWTEGIAVAIGDEAAREFARENLPLTTAANAWLKVLNEALPLIEGRAGQLGQLFDVPLVNAVIVAGNRGSSDGFGWVPDKIGINLQAFADTYGSPAEGATDRMVRIAAHEYLHLVTYAFYEDHLERRKTPIDRALWTMFFEGIGDYVSVSRRWWPDEQGNYSAVSAETLKALEPVLVERLELLLGAEASQEKELRSGIAMGKFDEKWGSLPVALWLHSEAKQCGESATLRTVMRLERRAVLLLAVRHVSPELRPRVLEIQRTYDGRSPAGADELRTCLAIPG